MRDAVVAVKAARSKGSAMAAPPAAAILIRSRRLKDISCGLLVSPDPPVGAVGFLTAARQASRTVLRKTWDYRRPQFLYFAFPSNYCCNGSIVRRMRSDIVAPPAYVSRIPSSTARGVASFNRYPRTPAANAAMTTDSWEYDDSTRIRECGALTRISPAALTPSSPGIDRSSTTTSGCSLTARSTARTPSAAVPTSSRSGAPLTNRASPDLTRAWSSAMSTRMDGSTPEVAAPSRTDITQSSVSNLGKTSYGRRSSGGDEVHGDRHVEHRAARLVGAQPQRSAQVAHGVTQELQTKMSTFRSRVRVDPFSVVSHDHVEAPGLHAHAHLCGRRPSVLDDVAQPLPDHPVGERRDVERDDEVWIDVDLDGNALLAGRSGDVAHRHREPLAPQVGWIQLDQHRAKRRRVLLHQVRDAVDCLARLVPVFVVWQGGGHGGQREGDAGEVLDDPVVQLLGDASSLELGGDEGVPHHLRAFRLVAFDTPRQPDGHRRDDDREQQQASDTDRQHTGDDRHFLSVQRVEGEVRLEHDRMLRLLTGTGVHLEQLAGGLLVDVLLLVQRGDVCGRVRGAEELLVFLLDRVGVPDQLGLVGPQDGAVGVPQLDVHDRAVPNTLPHGRVETPSGPRVPLAVRLGDERCRHPLSQELRFEPRLRECLVLGNPAAHVDRPSSQDHQSQHAAEEEAHQGLADRRLALSVLGAARSVGHVLRRRHRATRGAPLWPRPPVGSAPRAWRAPA